MAALIHHGHHHHHHHLAAVPSHLHHLSKPFAPSQVISFLSPSRPPLSVSSANPQFLSTLSSPLSDVPPSVQPPSLQNPNGAFHPLSNRELSQLLHLSIDYSDIQLNRAIHASILKFQHDIRLWNSLITSYVRLGDLEYAGKVFDSISSPDVVSYTALISGLVKWGREDEALQVFFDMRALGVEPNGYTFVALLTACMRLLDFEFGSQIHAFVVKTGYVDCTYVANSLMGLYGNCDYLDYVLKLFDEMPERDIASWNTVISFMVKNGMYDVGLELFQDLLVHEDHRMDYFTLSCLLVACAKCFEAKNGRGIHAYAHKLGYGSHLSVTNALIEFYAKCGCVEDVKTLFRRMPLRDVITWTEMIGAYMGFGCIDLAVDVFDRMPEKNSISYNALLSGFCRNGEGFRGLRLFCKMVEEGLELSDFTLTSVFHACGITKDKRLSEQIQAFVHKIDFGTNECIQSSLLDMCTRCGRMDIAEKIFHRLPIEQRSSITLTTMICGYARKAELDKATSLIHLWQREEYNTIDEVALASILGVCGDLGFQKLGEQFHCRALKCGFLFGVGVGNATVSMYGKCGDIKQAIKAFENMPAHDIVSWNCLLAGHILNRQGEEALVVWEKMQKRGVQPDTVTCALIISAYQYTNSNLITHCHDFFFSMEPVYHIAPSSDHYACLVSVLGYWGLLDKAEETIKQMPFEPKASVWRALLDSCRIHQNATIGRKAAKNILAIKPQDPSTYILQSNLYSASGRWHCSERIREEMKSRGFQKFPVQSWIIHQNQVHKFYARDKSHAESKDIYSALDVLFLECLKAGYEPDTSFVLHEVEEHQKSNFLLYHSGKLAVAYGLVVTRPWEAVRVMKNVHICGDCHTFFKYVSVVTKRVIEIRDASGFHRFAHGECSCNDYW